MTSISSSTNSLTQAIMQQMQKARTEMFAKADVDGSGGVSLDEFKALGASNPQGAQSATEVESMFTKLDTDGDGSLTQAEMDAGAPPQDIGMLSDKVMAALLEILGGDETEETATASSDAACGPPPPPPAEEVSSTDSSTETYDALDTNQDGVVSVEELAAGLNAASTALASNDTSDNEKSSILDGLKTAVKSFLLQLQEQQQIA